MPAPPVHVPTDDDEAGLNARVQDWGAVVEHGQHEAWWVLQHDPVWAGHGREGVRDAWTEDEARAFLARQHGMDSWRALLEALTTPRVEDQGFLRALRAVQSGDTAALRGCLRAEPNLVKRQGSGGRDLLSHAVGAATSDGSIPLVAGSKALRRTVRVLLELGADPSRGDESGWAPLHTACMCGDVELTRWLLDAGASPQTCLWGLDGGTPLSLGLFYAQAETVAPVAAAGREPDNLRTAAALGDLPRLKPWLAGELPAEACRGRAFFRPGVSWPQAPVSTARADVLAEALTWAARNGQIDAMAELVRAGADVNANPYRGTALLWAVYGDHGDAIDWLVKHGADVNLRHEFGGSGHGHEATALHLAAQFGGRESLRRLFVAGADDTIVDGAHGGKPREWAVYAGGEQATQAYDEVYREVRGSS